MSLELLTWLIPVAPLLAFAVIVALNLFVGREKVKRASWMLAWTSMFIALALSWIVAFSMFGKLNQDAPKDANDSSHKIALADETDEGEEAHGEDDAHAEEAAYGEDSHADDAHHGGLLDAHPVQIASSVVWMPFGEYTADSCDNCVRMGVAVDPLTTIMLFMVPFAVLMIFTYSVGYHNFGKPAGHHLGEPNHGKEEPLFSRFFAMMCLFAGAMLILTVADNLLMLFVGWEIMGFCSYSLIGFWYARKYDHDPKNPQKLPPRYASIKAFMTTRVADVVMLMGIVFFFRVFGTLNFSEALSAESLMNAVSQTYELGPWTFSGGFALGMMALMIFTGTAGKSAQWPFHVWLPNAMEGPTPVSAVIHAAAMVSAGIYLILRIFPLIAVGMEAYPTAQIIIAFIGAFTALMAATIAVAQDDVKGVLAYSTISQLGFMVAAIGIGAYIAAAFHLITHAFFKALLFLSSGSVIHGMEHGAEHEHDHHTDPQDMLNMGGLRKKMPITFWAFTIGGLALSGFPFVTAGFWSKDEIFADAWYFGSQGDAVAMFVFIMLALAAFLTAFYTARQLCLTFLGEPRTGLAEHAHESNRFMTIPLMLLSFFAITAGWVGIPTDFPILGKIFNRNFFHDFVGATLHDTIGVLYSEHLVAHKIAAPPVTAMALGASLVVALGGLFLGWWIYGRKPLSAGQEDPMKTFLGPIHTFLMNKWYWDEIYDVVFLRPVKYFSETIVYHWIDKGVIDGTLHLIANTFYRAGRVAKTVENATFDDALDATAFGFLDIAKWMRGMQRGRVQEYALLSTIIFSLFAFAVLYFSGALQGILG